MSDFTNEIPTDIAEEDMLPLTDDNPYDRIACVLALDTSGSMARAPITALNHGYNEGLRKYLRNDPRAALSADVAVVTFGHNGVDVEVPMQSGNTLPEKTFHAGGGTPMEGAILKSLDLIEERKKQYRAEGLQYYRAWLVVMSDGGAHISEQTISRIRDMEEKHAVTVFPIAIGNANRQVLNSLSSERESAKLDGLMFDEFFVWLANSMAVVSNSQTAGASDTENANRGGTIDLPAPTGWTKA